MTSKDKPDNGNGPKFTIDIEGTLHPWNEDTITVAQIRALGSLPLDQPVIEIDKDNNQRTLTDEEVVPLKPGLGFSKKVKYQRG
jgi:hypothetical protein